MNNPKSRIEQPLGHRDHGLSHGAYLGTIHQPEAQVRPTASLSPIVQTLGHSKRGSSCSYNGVFHATGNPRSDSEH